MNQITDVNIVLGRVEEHARFHNVQELIPWMERCRIRNAVATHIYSLAMPKEGNRLIFEECRQSHGRVRPCFLLDPLLMEESLPGKGDLCCRLQNLHPAAVWMHPDGYTLNEFYCGELLSQVNRLKLPLLFKSPDKDVMDVLPGLARSYPDIPFVLLRYGFRQARYIDALLRQCSNVYFEISLQADAENLRYFVGKYGSKQFLFGSGMPDFTAESSLGVVLYSGLTAEEQKDILSGNWERISGGKGL